MKNGITLPQVNSENGELIPTLHRQRKKETVTLLVILLLILTILLITSDIQAQIFTASETFLHTWHNTGLENNRIPLNSISILDFGAVGNGISDDTQPLLDALIWLSTSESYNRLYFPAGDYLITQTIHIPENTILYGERDELGNLSTLVFDFGGSDGDCFYVGGSAPGIFQSFQPQNLHAQWIEVSDGAEFLSGDFIELRQDNDPEWDNGDQWAEHAVGQIEQITEINGNTLHLSGELRANFEGQYEPEVRWIEPVRDIGFQNLIIQRIDDTAPVYGDHIHFNFASNCFVRGVELINCVQRLIHITYSSHIEITGCYFHHGFDYGGGGHGYGVECSFHTNSCLIEDNVFEHLRHSMLIQAGGNGNVFGYNFSTDSYRSEWPHDYASDIAIHGNRGFSNLFEGNIVGNLIFDGSHGEPAGPLNTSFRNRAEIYGVMITTACDYQNFAGNDITNGFKGQYSLAGDHHAEWGNREAGLFGGFSVKPSGTDDLPDVSYYLSNNPLEMILPGFWSIDEAFPSIGCGSDPGFGDGTIPSKERYENLDDPTLGAPECIHNGDVNSSGTVSSQDVQDLFYHILGIIELDESQLCAADCDSNGTISSTDCQRIFNTILYGDSCEQ